MLLTTLTRAVGTAIVLMIFAATAATAAVTCSRSSVTGANAMIGAGGRLNSALLDQAILVELNFQRCQKGLAALQASPSLRNIAQNQAKWMARNSTVSHQSGVPGQTTLSARMSSSGVRFSAGSENIGMVHRFQIDGQSFRINNAGSCKFSTYGGKPIAEHSYASLARYVVDLWMASAGHRRNILDQRVSMVGSAAALNVAAQYCGQVYLAQNFAG